jgi:RNA polymerase sigma-54 factor
MQKLGLHQIQTQKLSPLQIQFIKLLQVPTAELDARIEEELEINPALEEGKELEPEDLKDTDGEQTEQETDDFGQEEEGVLNLDEYLHSDEIAGYKMQGDGPSDEEERETPIATSATLMDSLISQLGFLKLDERRTLIGKQLIGSIDEDGYIRRELEAIVNDLAFSAGIQTTLEELEELLQKVQMFDPAGIAARDLRECILLQLERKDPHNPAVVMAIRIIDDYFDEFTKKHYDKILKKLNTDDEDLLKQAVKLITKCNPKPGGSGTGDIKTQYLIPDFILINNSGKLELSLNSRNAPELKISRAYSEMLDTYDKASKKDKKLKEAATFVKQKLDAAKWFIDAIKQRQQTLLRTMNAIIEYQYDYFLEGEESKLRPMILKDIAEKIDMDISTVSRVANSKAIQTEFGIFPLKYFFSEGISTDAGEDVSSREVKAILKEFIEGEDKKHPLSDDKLEKLLNIKGYNIARRTVAKYREQMNIPVARLRKEL